MQQRVEERVEAIGVERDRAVRAAAGVAMIGLLVGLSAFFVSFAPGI
jgi:hypothetical protein